MTACKDVLNTLRALMQAWLVNEYNRGNQVIRDATDAVSARLGMPTLEAFQRAHPVPTDFFVAVEVHGTRDILEGTLAFQELALTTHFTGLRVPLLIELTGELIARGQLPPYARHASKTLVDGRHEIFEVLDVRTGSTIKANGKPRVLRWVLLRSVFDGSLHEFKDPNLQLPARAWDLLVGRRIVINGFMTFDIIAMGVPVMARPLFSRALLWLFLRHEMDRGGWGIVTMATRYPALFTAFPLVNDPLEHAGLFSPAMARFMNETVEIYPALFDLLAPLDGARTATTRAGTTPGGTIRGALRNGMVCYGVLPVPSVQAFNDALHARIPGLVTSEIDEAKHQLTVQLARPARGVARGTGTARKTGKPRAPRPGTGQDLALPSLSSLLVMSRDECFARLRDVYRAAWESMITEIQDADGLDEAGSGPALGCFITLDRENKILINAPDQEQLEFLKASCTGAASQAGGGPARWGATLGFPEFLGKIVDAARVILKDEPGDDAGIEGEAVDNLLHDVLHRHDKPRHTLEAREARRRAWLDAPKQALHGKSPRECSGDPHMAGSLAMLLKQADQARGAGAGEPPARDWWDLLGLDEPGAGW